MSNIMTFICQYCGTIFIPKYRINKKQGPPTYCSYVCCGASKKSRIGKKCAHCGKIFETHQCRSNAKYCSWKCFQEVVQRLPNFCVDCGKSIKYCSIRCQKCAPKIHAQDLIRREKISKARKKYWENLQNHIMASENAKKQWANPRHRELMKHKSTIFWSNSENKIKISQKAKQRYQDPIWHKITGEALRKKWQDSEFIKKHSGENNHFYIHGKSEELYGRGWTILFKKEIRERDLYKCRNCGIKENGRTHHIHHIDFDKNNHDPMNLITLCKKCHDLVAAKHNREKWTEHFQFLQREILAT